MVDLQEHLLVKMVDLVVEEDLLELAVLQIEKQALQLLHQHKVIMVVLEILKLLHMAEVAAVVTVELVEMVHPLLAELVELEQQMYMHMDQEIQ
tara:strand:+ start:32 stop:313 length:282 start_codon:yes stop_codon:yes gene_type:complete